MTDPTTAAGDRPEPPALDWQPPLCPVCGNETVHLGHYPAACATVWACGACHAKWLVEPGCDDAPGEWMDPDEPQCRSEGESQVILPATAQCILGENHVDADSREAKEHAGFAADGYRMRWGTNPWVKETVPAAPKAERDARTAERARLRIARRVVQDRINRIATGIHDALGCQTSAYVPHHALWANVEIQPPEGVRLPGMGDDGLSTVLIWTDPQWRGEETPGWSWDSTLPERLPSGPVPLVGADGSPLGPDAVPGDVVAAVVHAAGVADRGDAGTTAQKAERDARTAERWRQLRAEARKGAPS